MNNQKRKGSKLFNGRLFAVIAVIALIVSYASFSNETPKSFKDVPKNNWAYDEVQFLTGKGIIYGYQDGTFKPGKSITRVQAVQMMLREKGIKDFSNVPNPGFKDIQPGDYGYNEVAKAVELGIIHGKVNKKGEMIFDPSGVLTRSQMAKILSLAYNLTGTSVETFSDIPKSHWAYTYVQGLANNKVTLGYPDGRFGGADYLSRVQFAVMMARTLDDSFKDTESETEPEPEKTQEPTGETYPDGWTAPVLKSSWSSNHTTNLATLQNELGFKDSGRIFALPEYPQGVIHVSGQGGKTVDITFFGWEDTSILPNSYRVPIVAKELFKLYFGSDASKVWNYFNSNDIPENFTANGFNVKAVYSSSTGGITLMLR